MALNNTLKKIITAARLNRSTTWVAAMCCILLTQSCRINFTLNGSAIDYTVYKTISVSNFPIRAALVYPPLQQTFENALLDYIARNTRLQVVDNGGDLEMAGEITGYSLSPQAVTENALASKTRLTITVRVKYTDTKNDKNDVDQSFSAYQDFDSSEMLTDVQDELCTDITEQLIDLIFNATIGNW